MSSTYLEDQTGDPFSNRVIEYILKEASERSAEIRSFESCHIFIDHFVTYPIFKTIESTLNLTLSSRILEKGSRKVFANIYTSVTSNHCFVLVEALRINEGDYLPVVNLLTSKYQFKSCITYDTFNFTQSIPIRNPKTLRYIAVNPQSNIKACLDSNIAAFQAFDVGIMIHGFVAELCNYCEINGLSFIGIVSNRSSTLPVVEEAKQLESAIPLISEVLFRTRDEAGCSDKLPRPTPELYKESLRKDPFLVATESMYI